MKLSPPHLAQRLLRLFLREDLFEEVSGDLEEKFFKTAKEKSPVRAKLNYWRQVFNYIRPFAMRKQRSTRAFLFNNNVKISWRQLKNQPMYSAVKIGGLALGITACILITLFIHSELGYDQHLINKDKVYRLHWINNNDGAEYKVLWTPPPLAEAFRNEFPEIESIGRINVGQLYGAGANEIRRDAPNDESTFEEGFIYADPQIVGILQPKFIYGDSKTALSEPQTMLITQRKAEKYFPNEDPVGKLMIVGNDASNPFRIDGVVEDPINSHLQYDFVMTLKNREFFRNGEQQSWTSNGMYIIYLMLHENADAAALARKMTEISPKYMLGPWSEEFLKHFAYGLQPVDEVHLYSANIRGPVSKGDIAMVWLFGAIAAFILIIACINFINLSTAKSANRAKEVGLRKTVGSSRGYIVNQFLTESIVFSLISFVIGCLLAWLLLPQFNQIADKSIEFPWTQWWLLPVFVVSSLAIGVLAGLYPSFYLSAFKPIDVLKGNVSRGSRNSLLRSTLVVFQFTTSIILIVSTVVIYSQVDFMLNRKPGFDKEQVLLLHGAGSLPGNQQTLKQELVQLPNVVSATVSDYIPVTGSDVKRQGHAFWVAESDKDVGEQTRVQLWSVDHDYIKTMGMKLVAGRDFNADLISDSTSIIITERTAKALGLEDPIGKQIVDDKTWTVIGVIEDFNYESLRSDIRPLSLVLGKSPGIISVKIAPGDMTSTLFSIENTWRKFSPNQSIRYTFLDDNFSKMYDDVRRTGNIFTSFAVLAMVVACLGLFALSAFMIEQRGKEISIRLLFGASVQKIFNLLTADFLKLILISLLISIPVAAWMAKQWLEGFHYRIDLSWEIFALTGAIAIAVALLTVSYQTIRAGLAKPVDKLRAD